MKLRDAFIRAVLKIPILNRLVYCLISILIEVINSYSEESENNDVTE